MDENWHVLTSLFPNDWKDIGRKSGALQRLRGFKSEDDLMRTLLLHVAHGYSLRETVTVAKSSGLADVSDVALLKRFKRAGPWFRELSLNMIKDICSPVPNAPDINMILVDATHVTEPGKTGSCWRIHYAFNFPDLTCKHFSLTPISGKGVGESFKQFPVEKNDCLIGDRGYSRYPGIVYVAEKKAFCLVRYNPVQMRLKAPSNREFELDKHLKDWPVEQQQMVLPCMVDNPNGSCVQGRLIIVRKSKAAIEADMKQVKRRASQKQYTIKRPVLEYAKYIMIFTTLPESDFDTQACLEWYRLRWQIELVFKRLKSLAGLGHLPKHDPESSQAWLYGKLFTGLLTEKLIHYGQSISPWGYEVST